jgi:hypothetical protein
VVSVCDKLKRSLKLEHTEHYKLENNVTTPMNQLLSFIRSYLSSTQISNEQRELAELIRKKIESFYLPLETEQLSLLKNINDFEKKQEQDKPTFEQIDEGDGFLGEDFILNNQMNYGQDT